jgi:hypothetical protein
MGLFIFVSSSVQKLEPKNTIFLGSTGTYIPISTYFPKKIALTLFSDFLFLNTYFRIGRHENKEQTKF